MRQLAGMRQDKWAESPTIIVHVQLSDWDEPETHNLYGRIDVYALGHPPTRHAEPNECIVRLQDWFLGSYWRTIEEANTQVWGVVSPPHLGYEGNYVIHRSPRLDPGQYRLTAEHIESGAEYGREFSVKSDFTIGDWGSRQTISVGSPMPTHFRQSQAKAHRRVALPEPGPYPISGKKGKPGVRVQVRQGGYADREPFV